MEKAYDLKDLGMKLKAKGLVQAEEMAEAAYEVFKLWLKESAELSTNPFDNVVIPFLGTIDSVVMPEINKIDGDPAN